MRALYASVQLCEEIPPEHFKAVGVVIVFIMRKKGNLPEPEKVIEGDIPVQ